MKVGASAGAHVDDESYDPETGVYYVCSHFGSEVARSSRKRRTRPEGKPTVQRRVGYRRSISKGQSRGYITAYNLQTGQIVWADEFAA